MKKPADSDVFDGDRSFTLETSKNIDFNEKKGERYEMVRPHVSDIWRVRFSKAFDSHSYKFFF